MTYSQPVPAGCIAVHDVWEPLLSWQMQVPSGALQSSGLCRLHFLRPVLRQAACRNSQSPAAPMNTGRPGNFMRPQSAEGSPHGYCPFPHETVFRGGKSGRPKIPSIGRPPFVPLMHPPPAPHGFAHVPASFLPNGESGHTQCKLSWDGGHRLPGSRFDRRLRLTDAE